MPCLLQNALKGQKLLAPGNPLGGVDASLSPCKGKSFIKEKSVLLIFGGDAFFLYDFLSYNPLAFRKPEASGSFIPVKSVNISI